MDGDISPELRLELMDLARTLRTAAEKIDRIVQPKRAKEVDESGEPTFRFKAKVPIPDNFFITRKLAKYALDRGFKEDDIKEIAQTFVNWYKKKGTKWQDWSRVWMDWIREEVKRRESRPATLKTTDRMNRL